jgi:hypothetical protein
MLYYSNSEERSEERINTMFGFYGRILTVNLTDESFEIETLREEICGLVLGGKGLATHLLLTKNPPGGYPFSAGNHLIFATALSARATCGAAAARAAGCAVIALTGTALRSKLAAADLTVDSLRDLTPEIIKGLLSA